MSLFPVEEGVAAAEPSSAAHRAGAQLSRPVKSQTPVVVTGAAAVQVPGRADGLAQLGSTRTAFEAQKGRFEAAMVEVCRLGEHVADLEARIRKLTEPEQPLARGGAMLDGLEQNAASVKAQLDATASKFKVQKSTIASALADASRLTQIVSGLEERLDRLSEKGQSLGHAAEAVGRLEQRAAKTTAKLEQASRATAKLADDVARLQNAVLTAAAPVRTHLEKVTHRTTTSRFVGVLRSRKSRVAGGAVGGALIVLAAAGVISERGPRTSSPIPGASPVQFTSPSTQRPDASPSVAREPSPATSPPPNRTEQRPRSSKSVIGPVEPTVFAGDLSIESSPGGAAVFIDRQYVGETPLQLSRIRAGSRLVRIERSGHQPWTAVVLVAADKQVHVSARLQTER